jgi:hypothetical protein
MRQFAARLSTVGLALVLATGAPRNAHAQIGILVGANFSTLADFSGGATLETFSAASGYHVGLFAQLGGAIALRPAVVYLNAGSMFDGASFSTQSFDMSYLAIPVDLKLSLIPAVYIFGGPEFQLLLSADAQADFEDDLKSWVTHGGAGLGIQLGPLHVEGRYVFGLSSITPDSYTVGGLTFTGAEQVSNAFRLTAGFKF